MGIEIKEPLSANKVVPSQRLSVVVAPKAGEPLLSWLARAAIESGLYRVTALIEHEQAGRVRKPLNVAFSDKLDLQGLAHLMRCDVADIEARMHRSLGGGANHRLVNWYGTRLPRWCIEYNARRVPSVWASNQIVADARWSLRKLDFCPVSGAPLVDVCPQCSQRLGWTHVTGLDQCASCGFTFDRTSNPPPVSRSAQLIVDLVAPHREVRQHALAALDPAFAKEEPGDVFVLACEIAEHLDAEMREERAKVSRYSIQSPGLSEEALARAGDVLSNWPCGADALWECAKFPVRHRTFGTLFEPLANRLELAKAGDTLSWTFMSGMCARQRIVWPDVVVEADKYVVAGRVIDELAEIANNVGAPLTPLYPLLADLRAYSARRRNPPFLTEDQRAELTRVAAAWKQSLSPRQAAIRLKTSVQVVDALADKGVVSYEADPGVRMLCNGQDRIAGADVGRIEDQINGMRITRPANNRWATEIFAGILSPKFWACLYDAALAGDFQTFARDGRRQGLGDLTLDVDEAMSWMESLPTAAFRPKGFVTANSCERFLPWIDVILTGVANAEVLETEVRDRGSFVSAADLQTYFNTHVTTQEIMNTTGRGLRSVSITMGKAGIKPGLVIRNKFKLWKLEDAVEVFGETVREARPFAGRTLFN